MPNPTPSSPAGIPKERPYLYVIGVLLFPVLVLWRQDNALFTGYGYLDPWFYLGFFRNLVEFKRNLFPATYYGSRLSWILPGAAVHGLFPPVAANCILHLGVHTVATRFAFSDAQVGGRGAAGVSRGHAVLGQPVAVVGDRLGLR